MTQPARDDHGRFIGSGNPGGRPKEIAHVRELARAWTAESIATLGEILQNPKAKSSSRVAAANALLDRGWGRAPQTIRVQQISEMEEHELDDYIARLEAELGLTAGGPAGTEEADGTGLGDEDESATRH